MAKKPNQKLKLLYLMRILLERTDENHTLTLSELLTELGKYDISAERKSLYDDLELLKLYGIDIAVRRDRQVRYYVAAHRFSMAELKLLIDAVQASKAMTPQKSLELCRKLEGLTSRYEGTILHEQIAMEHRLKAANEEIFLNVERVFCAIHQNRQIRFRSFEWNAHKQRLLRKQGEYYTVSPYALNWDDENYYLIAYDNEAEKIKHFRVDKMLEVSVLDRKREGGEPSQEFDTATYCRSAFGMYGGEYVNARIRADNSLASVVIDRFGREVTILSNSPTHFEFAAKVMLSPTFLSWVLGFGGQMQLLSPEIAVERLKQLATDALALYEN